MKRELNFEIVARCDKAMSLEEAERFAKENGGRLPDQIEAMLILSKSHYPDLSFNNYGYWCKFRPYYNHESGYGYFHAGEVGTMDESIIKMERFWCGVIVVKDAAPTDNVARMTCENLGEFRAFYKYGALWEAWIGPDGKVELECKEKAGVLRDEAVRRMNDEYNMEKASGVVGGDNAAHRACGGQVVGQ